MKEKNFISLTINSLERVFSNFRITSLRKQENIQIRKTNLLITGYIIETCEFLFPRLVRLQIHRNCDFMIVLKNSIY